MKRSKPKFTFVKRDRNLENAFTMGKAARENDKPDAACPDWTQLFEKGYARRLMDEWMRGWNTADRQMDQPRLEMKGAD